MQVGPTASNPGPMLLKQESTAAHATVTGKEKTVNVKIVFYNGTATAYIDGERVLEKSGIFNVLRERGIEEGDIVSLYDIEFEYVP